MEEDCCGGGGGSIGRGFGATLEKVMRHRTSSPPKMVCSNQRTETRMLPALPLLAPLPLLPPPPPWPRPISRAMAADRPSFTDALSRRCPHDDALVLSLSQ